MKKVNLAEAKIVHEAIEAHEDFISQCDHVIRNKGKNDSVYVDRWLVRAMEQGIVTHNDFVSLITDLRDIATTKLQDLDKRLEAL